MNSNSALKLELRLGLAGAELGNKDNSKKEDSLKNVNNPKKGRQ